MSQPCVLLLSMALDFGGAETHVISLAKALQKSGLRVLVASNGGRLVPELDAAGIRHYTVALHARNPLALLGGIGVIKRIVQSEGVQLMHAHARIPAWVADRVSRSTRVPLVTSYHGLYSPHWFLRLFTVAGQQTIAVCQHIKQYLIEKFGFPSEQITVIYNGIDTEEFALTQPPQALQQVTYISRLSGERGGVALTVLDAVALLRDDFPDLQVAIVGDGDRLPEVQAKIVVLNNRWGSRFCRALGGRTDIPQILAQTGIVVGQGRVALEAMASSRPVIVASEFGMHGLLDADTLPMAMEHNFVGQGSKSYPTEPEALAKALRNVLVNQEVAKQAAQLGREAVLAHYSVVEKTKEVLAVYEKEVPNLLRKRGNVGE